MNNFFLQKTIFKLGYLELNYKTYLSLGIIKLLEHMMAYIQFTKTLP